MNHPTIRLHPITSLLLALALTASSLAVSAPPAAAAGITPRPGTVAPAAAPVFPDCPASRPPACKNLQVLLLIDDSSSMLYSDPTKQRLEGAKNVLDILAKEYYLPAVAAQAEDPGVELPKIQVALVRFSSVVPVIHNSGWKTIAPQSIEAWSTQLKAFDPDLGVEVDYSKRSHATDFRTAFSAAAELARSEPQTSDCPRLVMLFTDGVPNLGRGNLAGAALAGHMQELREILLPAFNRGNDLLFVTAFGSGSSFRSYWNRDHKQKWEELTKDSAGLDPRRVLFVPAQELASRMERIIGSAIGNQVFTLVADKDSPQQYTTEIPAFVRALRLTYYTIKSAGGFSVTGPDGKTLQPEGKSVSLSGADTSIQVLEILDPAPGSYGITTSAKGGLLTQLLRLEKISARLALPADGWLQFSGGHIGIQLFGAEGKPLAVSPGMSLQAALTQAGAPNYLTLSPGADAFTADWMPLKTDTAFVDACATLKDSWGRTIVLYNGRVGEINIDPLAVQSGPPDRACVPTRQDTSVPLQLVNGRSRKPAAIDAQVLLTSGAARSPDGSQLNGSIAEVDASSGSYSLRFRPTLAGDVQFPLKAVAIVNGAEYQFYDDRVPPIRVEPPRQLVLDPGRPATLADRISVKLFLAFQPTCVNDRTEILIGRRLFGLFGATPVRISGRYLDAGNQVTQPGIERFALQLVSADGGPSSDRLSNWATPVSDEGLSTLELRSPGLGLYTVAVTDQGENLDCTVLASLPTQQVLLISDFWEYLVILAAVLLLLLLAFILFRRSRKRPGGNQIAMMLASLVLVGANVFLVNGLTSRTYKCQLNCAYLVDRTLNTDTLCKGVAIPTEDFEILPGFTVPGFTVYYPWPPWHSHKGPWHISALKIPEAAIPILPALKVIDPPLEVLRRGIAWGIVGVFALASLFLTFMLKRWLTAEGRRAMLTSLSIVLLFFVLLLSAFYLTVGR